MNAPINTEEVLQEVFELFSETEGKDLVKRENVSLLLEALGCIVKSHDVEASLPPRKEIFTLDEIRRILAAERLSILSQKEVLEAFHAFDRNKTGKMAVSTLKAILQAGPGLSQEEIDAALEIMSPTPEGVVEYAKSKLFQVPEKEEAEE
ncbi:uncharacterized protein NEMAJ01_2304 [Nematocida major]|uniref:uncharacterized protein n=1 Tax=Nematocida major TaxID=1912982 RepID=UPI00200727F5|nr:uncharacterized protein NEMAJ01_2304 [Nematocida major]KAH9387408.1 hypothetical protein NEMAJ01_2304 [Nematocida major]